LVTAIPGLECHPEFYQRGNYQPGWGIEKCLDLRKKEPLTIKKNLEAGQNLVPIYTSRNSLNPLKHLSSDDYFAFIGMGNGVWEERSKKAMSI